MLISQMGMVRYIEMDKATHPDAEAAVILFQLYLGQRDKEVGLDFATITGCYLMDFWAMRWQFDWSLIEGLLHCDFSFPASTSAGSITEHTPSEKLTQAQKGSDPAQLGG